MIAIQFLPAQGDFIGVRTTIIARFGECWFKRKRLLAEGWSEILVT